MNVFFGVDVGGTNVKFGLFDSTGTLLKKWEVKTPAKEGNSVFLEGIAQAILTEVENRGLTTANIAGVGIGIPGPVQGDGYLEACVNLNIKDLNVSQELSSRLGGVKVVASNDANAAALGEMWQGGGKGHENLVFVTLGTGVGSGLVMNGQIVNGKHGIAGEIGHIIADPEAPFVCNCGGRGCLDLISSATGVVNNMKRFVEERGVAAEYGDEFTAKEVLDLAKEGDPIALGSVEYSMEFLGRTLATIGQVIDPEVFIVGGGLANAGEFLLDIIRKYYRQYSTFSKEKAEVLLAQLGNDAGIYGAAKMVLPS